jgi:hypothetical protein
VLRFAADENFNRDIVRGLLRRKPGEKSARTVASPDGLLIVDYAASGRPLGVEITAPQAVPLGRLNQLLAELGEPPLAEQDYSPARAA